MDAASATRHEISCRVTRTLVMYLKERHGSLGSLLEGLALDEAYLCDTNNWVSHAFLQILYARMARILGEPYPVYEMALSSQRFESLGLLDRIARLIGTPRLLYTQAPLYNRLLKANGDVIIRGAGDSWVVLEDRYHEGASKTRHDCDYTRGIITGIPTIFHMPLAKVEEIECQVSREAYGPRPWPDNPPYGCGGCLYRIEWSPGQQPPLLKRLFQRYSVYRRAIADLQETNRIVQQRYEEARNLARELETANQQLLQSQRLLEKQAAELKASEGRYRLLAENVSDTIWMMDLKTLRLSYVSPSVERMLGYKAEEILGMTVEGLLPSKSVEQVMPLLKLAQDRGSAAAPPGEYPPEVVEVQHRHRDGTLRWVEIRASLLAEETGRPVGILGVSRDISERKRADQLYQAKMAAEAASVAKSGFLANMSHELRTPLNHIMGFTELILDGTFGELNDAQAEHLRDVYRSSEHLLSLVNEILDMGRIEAGRMEISPAEVRLGPLLEESLSIIRDRALKRRIEVRAQFDRIPATVVADERRLRQILYNLLANAVKFTPEGGHLRLAARVLEGAGEASSGRGARSELEISVADSGIGISAEDLEKIFDPFTQVESSLSRRFPGSGLGLTLARTLVQLHGGRIWAESDGPGRGATFRFTLPL